MNISMTFNTPAELMALSRFAAELATLHGHTETRVDTPAPTPVVAPVVAEPAEDVGLASTAQFDAEGLPWDERIHASSRTMSADGKWRRRRNVSDDVVAQVRSQLAGAPTTAAVTTPVQYAPPVGAPVTLPVGHPANFPQPIATPAPAPAPVEEVTFPSLLALMQTKIAAGHSYDTINSISQKYGFPIFALVATNPAIWPQVAVDLKALTP